MAANLTIDKIFADNLGTAFGGCVRDQSLNLFSPEIARSADSRRRLRLVRQSGHR